MGFADFRVDGAVARVGLALVTLLVWLGRAETDADRYRRRNGIRNCVKSDS